jgi:glycosyltransferase involved in cell wall biosynthesis
MKIAIVYDMVYPYSIGGVEVRNFSLAETLAKKGYDVHLYGVKLWWGPDKIKRNGVFIHGVCRYKHKYDFKGRRSIIEPILFSFKLFLALFREKFDIIDCSAFPYFPCFSCKFYSILKKVPLIITWHEVWQDYWYSYLGSFKGFFGLIIERIVAKLTNKIISVSDRTKGDLVNLGISNENIDVIYNWIDVEKIKWLELDKEKSDIIYAGRHLKHKNIDLLIRSLVLVKKKYPKIKAVITGEGPETKKLKFLTKKLGLEDNIDFLGFIEDHFKVYSKMKSSKIFVLPSILEGFGIVSIEANACGLPVITIKSRKNAAADLIENGKNGFICNLTEQELANNIIKLLDDNSLRGKMGNISKKYAEKYDKNKIVNKIEKVYVENIK